MGLSVGHLDFYLYWFDQGWLKPGASILDLGAQQLFCQEDPKRINEFVTRLGGAAYAPSEVERIADGTLAGPMLERAGFKYASIDHKPYPYSIVLDLNRERLPAEHRSRYQLVTNSGTSEHILNQWNVFEVMHDAAEPGGILYNAVPCCGYFEHGIINYNAKFWWALAEENGYRMLKHWLWFDKPMKAPPASFQESIEYEAALWQARDGWANVLLQKVDDRPFAGFTDPVFR